jgi:hypothetical protein
VIQKQKNDMAAEIIDAGRFDQQTTNDERKETLEAILGDERRSKIAKNEARAPPAARLSYCFGHVRALTSWPWCTILRAGVEKSCVADCALNVYLATAVAGLHTVLPFQTFVTAARHHCW